MASVIQQIHLGPFSRHQDTFLLNSLRVSLFLLLLLLLLFLLLSLLLVVVGVVVVVVVVVGVLLLLLLLLLLLPVEGRQKRAIGC